MKNRNAAVLYGSILVVFRICLYRLSHLVILGNKVGNTTDSVLVMGENRGGHRCKDCLYRVKGLGAMDVRF